MLVCKLNFRHDQTLIVAIELIDFDHEILVVDDVARLFNDARAQAQHFVHMRRRHLIFPFVAGDCRVLYRRLYSYVALVATQAHPDGLVLVGAEVALDDVVAAERKMFELAFDEEFPFYLKCQFL